MVENQEKEKKEINELCAELVYVADMAKSLLWKITDTYYSKYHSPPPKAEISKQDFLSDPAIQFLMTPGNTLPEGMNKHSKLFKNIAILLVNADFTRSEIKSISRKICANCPGHSPREIIGWTNHVRAIDRDWAFNRAEFESSLKEARK